MSKQIALISGANGGIGLSAATLLAREHGYHVIIGCRSLDAGLDAVKSITEAGHTASAVQLDVTSDPSIFAVVEHIRSTFGRLDVLINNAGVLLDHAGLSARELFTRSLEVNAIGAACLTDACLPLLRLSKLPRVVFVSSRMGSLELSLDKSTMYYPIDYKGYDTSKAALNMVALNYKRILGDTTKVNVVCPGLVKTRLTNYIEGGREPDEGAAKLVEMATVGRDGPSGTWTDSYGVVPW